MITISDDFPRLILRDGVRIGTVNDDVTPKVAHLDKDPGGVVKGQIRKALGVEDLQYLFGAVALHADTSEAVRVMAAPTEEPQEVPVVVVGSAPGATISDPEPPFGPAGDKTPAVVAWRKRNWPTARFEAVYKGRVIPKV